MYICKKNKKEIKKRKGVMFVHCDVRLVLLKYVFFISMFCPYLYHTPLAILVSNVKFRHFLQK